MRDFYHTIGVLAKEHRRGNIENGSCRHCAVGTIVSEACPAHLITRMNVYSGWPAVFYTDKDDDFKQKVCPDAYKGDAKEQIDSTGYSWEELARIEHAFEVNVVKEEYSITAGLLAVVDILADIHNISPAEKQKAKDLFINKA